MEQGRPKKWTNEKTKKLIKDFNNELSYKEMAEKYGVTVPSVRTRLYIVRKEGLIGKRL